eukprot:146684-Pelagomonas_calceolata.AAC.1
MGVGHESLDSSPVHVVNMKYAGVPKALLGHRVVKEQRRPPLPLVMPEGYQELLKKCWSHRPEDRCGMWVGVLLMLYHALLQCFNDMGAAQSVLEAQAGALVHDSILRCTRFPELLIQVWSCKPEH